MSVSRRRFLKAGVVATVCAGLPLKSVLADVGVEGPPSGNSLEQLGYYNKATFDAYLNSKFRVYLSPANIRGLKLAEVSDHQPILSQQADAAISPGQECFSLLFTTYPGKPFTQDTYLIKHDALGTFYMFVVPVGARVSKTSDLYEAVIYRREQVMSFKDPAVVTKNDTDSVGVHASPQQNQVIHSAGGPVIALTDRQLTREEKDVYRFRPAETAPPVVVKEIDPYEAAKRPIYPLTLAQAPTISGLKLGMTPDEVLALFPGSKTDEDLQIELARPASRFGVTTFKIDPTKYSPSRKFQEISRIGFTLLDGRVSTLNVAYEGVVWEHVDDLVAKFSARRNLPAPDAWEAYVGMADQLKTLKCKDFEISVFAGGANLSINYILLRDLLAAQKYQQRKAKARKESAG